MKIPGSDGSDAANLKISRSTDARTGEQSGVGQSIVRQSVVAGTAQDGQQRAASAKSKVDSIKVSSLGALLQSELNPAKMADERAQKVAALKEQIAQGTYAPDSQAVARSLSEEIYLEIAMGGDLKE